MELNILCGGSWSIKYLYKQNYKYYRNIHSITIYNKHFGCHAITSSGAVTTLLLVAGGGGEDTSWWEGKHCACSSKCFVSFGNCHGDRNVVFWSSRTHIHPLGLHYTSHQTVANASTYKKQYKTQERTQITSAGYKPAISDFKELQTSSLTIWPLGQAGIYLYNITLL